MGKKCVVGGLKSHTIKNTARFFCNRNGRAATERRFNNFETADQGFKKNLSLGRAFQEFDDALEKLT